MREDSENCSRHLLSEGLNCLVMSGMLIVEAGMETGVVDMRVGMDMDIVASWFFFPKSGWNLY